MRYLVLKKWLIFLRLARIIVVVFGNVYHEPFKQGVVLDGSHLDQPDVLSGVPQGTVFVPLIFLAYIKDMPESPRSSDCRLFAYDSLLYCVVNKTSDCKLLQQDLTALEQWKVTWQMSSTLASVPSSGSVQVGNTSTSQHMRYISKL